MDDTYFTMAEACINGKKVKAMKSGLIRKNTYLLKVSER